MKKIQAHLFRSHIHDYTKNLSILSKALSEKCKRKLRQREFVVLLRFSLHENGKMKNSMNGMLGNFC